MPFLIVDLQARAQTSVAVTLVAVRSEMANRSAYARTSGSVELRRILFAARTIRLTSTLATWRSIPALPAQGSVWAGKAPVVSVRDVSWSLLRHQKQPGSSLVTGHVPTHPSPEASPEPNQTLTQTLDLTQGRGGAWPATEQGPTTITSTTTHRRRFYRNVLPVGLPVGQYESSS